MHTDLWYFYERDLNKGSLCDFHNSLPEHLMKMFKKSVEPYDSSWYNVLQGYRGPHNDGSSGDSEKLSAINGLQEVKYRFGISKYLHLYPILGPIAFLMVRAVGNTNWNSLYFDSKTGECLSHDKEIAAWQLNETGRKLLECGKFSDAKEYFSNAYTHSNKEESKESYQNNKNIAQAAIDKNNEADLLNKEGNELHNQRKYEEAYAKFDQAYHKCASGYSEKNRFDSNRDIAKNNLAEELNNQGNQFWVQNDYSKAVEMYNLAYSKCTDGYKNKQTFENNRDKAKAATDKNKQADLLDKVGNELLKQRKFEEAYAKFDLACNKCSSGYSGEATFNRNRDAAKNYWTEELNRQGDRLWEQEDHSGAFEKYNLAYNECTNGYKNKQVFKNNRDKAQAEFDVVGLKELGDREFEAGRYDNAKVKYQQAYEKSLVSFNKNKYYASINKTIAELDAIGLKELGDRDFEAERYDSAKVKYQQAYEKSSVSFNKSTYNTYVSKAKAELDAVSLKELGDREFEAGKYDSAKIKYQQAYEKSSVRSNKKTYNICICKTITELDANDLKELGDRESEAGRYDSAKIKYQQAYEKSSVRFNKSTYKTYISKAKAELDAVSLKELGDEEFEAGRYDSAKIKYQQAYEKSSVSFNKSTYKTYISKAKAELDAVSLKKLGDEEFNMCRYRNAYKVYQDAYNMSSVDNNKKAYSTCILKTKTELDAVNLKQQNDKDLEAGRYDSAKAKYKQAVEITSVTTNKNFNKACINETQTKARSSIITEFNLIIKQDISEKKLNHIGKRLGKMMDESYGNDPEIVNRFHFISLKLASNKMKSQLKSVDQEHMSDLVEAIMNLLETEIEVLKILNITDESLEQELKSLEEKLNALDPDIADEDENQNMLVNIETIASRADEISEQVEDLTLERLGQTEHILGGNALESRDALIAPAVETYTISRLNQILQLRITALDTKKRRKEVKLLKSKIVDIKSKVNDLNDVIDQFADETNINKTTVIPLLIIGHNKQNNINHWVGLISEHIQDEIIITYLDSENSNLEGLQQIVLDSFKTVYPKYKISFKTLAVEQQKYNNCGSELIENVVLYITGSRVDQEASIYLHNSLWEESLIDSSGDNTTETLNNCENDNEVNSTQYDLNKELNDLLNTFNPYEQIPGIITIKLNKEKTLLCFNNDNQEYVIENDGKIIDQQTYNSVRSTLMNKRKPIPESKWDNSFKRAKKQFIPFLIREKKLEDQEGFLKEFHQFINELPEVSDKFFESCRKLKEINFEDCDEDDPRLEALNEIHKEMLNSFELYKNIGENYIEQRKRTAEENNMNGQVEDRSTTQEDEELTKYVLPSEANYPKQSSNIKRIFEILNLLERGEALDQQISIIASKLKLSAESTKKLKTYFSANAINKRKIVQADNSPWYIDEDMNSYGRVLEKYWVDINTQFANRLTEDRIEDLLTILKENQPKYICYNIGGKVNKENSGMHWVAIFLVKREGKIIILYKDSLGDWNNSSVAIESLFKEHSKNEIEFIRHSKVEQEDSSSCGPMTINNLEIMAKKVKDANDEGKDGIDELIRLFKEESHELKFTSQDQVQSIRISHLLLKNQYLKQSNLEQDPNIDDIKAIMEKLKLSDDEISANNGEQDNVSAKTINTNDSRSTEDMLDTSTNQKFVLESYVNKINEYYDQVKDWEAKDIQLWSRQHKGSLNKNLDENEICRAIAVMDRANELSTVSLSTEGHRFRHPQKIAILIFMQTSSKGHISQINTGEGKTTIVSVVAALKVMQGYKSHIITSNNILAADGVKEKKLFYSLLNISVADNNPDEKYTDGPRECYSKDVVYGSITSFQFDWLRDSFEQLKTLGGINYENIWVMLDEIDSLLIDQGSNIAKLSGPFPGMESLRYVYINIWVALAKTEEKVTQQILENLKIKAEELEKDTDIVDNQKQWEYEKYEDSLRESFLDEIKKQIKSQKNQLINKQVTARHLHQYADDSIDRWIEHAFNAKYQYTENVEYKIGKDKNDENIIVPVDNQNTGVSMKNTILSNGLHQFLQIKHNVCLTYESLTSCYVSNLDYIKKYGNKLSGVTGTLGSKPEMNLLGSVFNLGFSVIPPFKPKKFMKMAGMVCEDEQFVNDIAVAALGELARTREEYKCIKEDDEYEIIDIKTPRAVLIVCTSISDVKIIAKEILKEAKGAGLDPKIYTYIDEGDVHVTEKTLNLYDIVIATNLGGRGTDFKTSPQLEVNGGLHVIEAFLPCNKRVEDQGLGRTGRQGNKGTGQIIVRRSEVEALGIRVDNTEEVDFDDIMERRDELETIRVNNIAENKVMELEFKGWLFNKFSSQYGALKESHKTGVGNEVVKWIYVLKDLKEKWAFWLEKQAYNIKSIKEIVAKQQAIYRSKDAQLSKAVDVEYEKFLEEANPIVKGKISHNPFYSICLAERYLESGNGKEDRDRAKSELHHALSLGNELYTAYIKLFEISIEDGQQVLRRYAKAVAKIYNFSLEESCPQYKKNALDYLQKANAALAIEHDYLKEIIEGKDSSSSEENSYSILESIIVSENQDGGQNLFLKHLQSRLVCLGAYKGNIESLIKQMEGQEKIENPQDVIGPNDGVIIDVKASRYLSKLESDNELKKHITDRSVDELEYVGLSSVYQVRKIHDVHEEVILGAQIQIGGAFALLTSAYAFPVLLPVNGPIAGAMISEGITDIITALIQQGQSGFDKKDYIKGKVISYGITILTMGISAIMSSTKILNKAVNTCRQLATKLRSVKGPFAGICQFLANRLDKLAIYLEFMIEKIEFARKTGIEQAKYLAELKDARKLQQFQQLQKTLKVSDTVVTHGQMITQIVKTSVVGAVEGVVISVAMERIVTASLSRLMSYLQPYIKKKVYAVVSNRINNENANGKFNKFAEQDVTKALANLTETNLGEDIQQVSKEISLGIMRHSSNWQIQLLALGVDSILSGIDIATSINKACDKFLITLSTNKDIENSDSEKSKLVEKIIDGISNQTSNILYNKIVAITGKLATTLPKILYRGYRAHQEQKHDEKAISDIREKLDEIDKADGIARAANANCAHDAVSETLGLDIKKGTKQLADATNLAASEDGASVEDTKQLFIQNGLDVTSCEQQEAEYEFKKQNSDRGVVCLSNTEGMGHVVPVTFDKNSDSIMVTEGGRSIPLDQYKLDRGFSNAEFIIPENLNSTTLPSVQHECNLNRIIRATHPIDHVGQGEGMKFGRARYSFIVDSTDPQKIGKFEGGFNPEFLLQISEGRVLTNGGEPSHAKKSHVGRVEGKTTFKDKEMCVKKLREVMKDQNYSKEEAFKNGSRIMVAGKVEKFEGFDWTKNRIKKKNYEYVIAILTKPQGFQDFLLTTFYPCRKHEYENALTQHPKPVKMDSRCQQKKKH